jgi:hypothetical protein
VADAFLIEALSLTSSGMPITMPESAAKMAANVALMAEMFEISWTSKMILSRERKRSIEEEG